MIWVEVVTIGSEILSGRTADSNFAFIARGLIGQGLTCSWHTTVRDERDAIAEALENALARAEVVIATGGLGPTPDDITRKVMASVLRRQLVLREDVLDMIKERYRRMDRTPPANIQAQALVPLGADILENPLGTAPGLRMRTEDGRVLYALPGVPYEMEAIAARYVLPEIASMAPPVRRCVKVVRTIGVAESSLADRITPHLPAEVEVAYLPHLGMTDLYFTKEGDPERTRLFLNQLMDDLRPLMGTWVFSETEDETLESILGRELLTRGWRIGVAESLTGGALSSQIVSVAGASRYFAGGVVAYENEIKSALLGVPESTLATHGAVSDATARAMAAGVRARMGVDVGLATTGVAGPTGGTGEKPVGLVYMAVETPTGAWVIQRRFPGGREQVIGRTVVSALDLARRAITGLPIETTV